MEENVLEILIKRRGQTLYKSTNDNYVTYALREIISSVSMWNILIQLVSMILLVLRFFCGQAVDNLRRRKLFPDQIIDITLT